MAFQINSEVQTLINSARAWLLKSNNRNAMDNYSSAGGLVFKAATNCRGTDRSIGYIQAAQLKFKACNYSKAYEYLSQVDSLGLPDKWQKIFNHYFRVCGTRIASGWTEGRTKLLMKLYHGKKWHKLLKLLADCPYVLSDLDVAKMRAEACSELGKTEAAKQFDLDAKKLTGVDLGGHVSNYD